MQSVEGENPTGTTVFMDEKFFINCRFENCTLVYGGGDYGWLNCSFINCKLHYTGPAQRTWQYFKDFGQLKESTAPEKEIPASSGSQTIQ